MGRINVLDVNTVNKISAGEVVERPASAIKEMVENSIDAGADKITIEIKNGGISFMRVTDNGSGIFRDDIEKAFLPHSTSKISKIEDLASLYTMGFRGEALASISSVSKVELITKTKEEELGTVVCLEGGKIISKEDAGCPDGTTIVVTELFYNTPARMKFLKKDSTEGAHIADVVDKMILGNPSVSFKFINNGKVLRMSPGNGSIEDAFATVYGRDFIDKCFAVDYEYNGIKVKGLAGQPYASRPNRSMQVFYVNKRAVRSKTISFAAEQAYNTMLMNGQYPVLLLYLELNSAQTDVNVHPSKLEIKFSDEKSIHDAVLWAVQNALFNARKDKEVERQPKVNVKRTYSDYSFKENKKPVSGDQIGIKQPLTFEKEKLNAETLFSKEVMDFFKPVEEKKAPAEKNEISVNVLNDSFTEQETEDEGYKIIGQIFSSYIVVEQKGKMLLIDQHAAHERINFNKLSENKQIDGQILLCPEMVSVTDIEGNLIENNLEIFNALGFEIENFGNNKFIVRQAPCDVESEFVDSLVHEIINLLSLNADPTQLWDKALFTVACKSAVKANMRIGGEELKYLTEQVLYNEKIKTCPHGRPVVISFDKKFIEKEFKRII